MTAKDDDVADRMEAILAAKEAELEAAKSKETVVGSVMKNGGGATVGAGLGYAIGIPVAAVLAPFTFGLSAVIPFALGAAGGVVGHKASKKIDD
jgi:hypothetical protein